MTADGVLLVLVGLAAGFALGHAQAWRFARKLEHHRVRLVDWDQLFDAHAEVNGAQATITPLRASRGDR
jgi:hypothetical protein